MEVLEAMCSRQIISVAQPNGLVASISSYNKCTVIFFGSSKVKSNISQGGGALDSLGGRARRAAIHSVLITAVLGRG